MTEPDFQKIFCGSPYFHPESALVLEEGGEVTGFACGASGKDLPLGDHAGYVTCCLFLDSARTPENARLMLEGLERDFASRGLTQSDVLFFNPMMLPWVIPGTPGHLHNNAPGAPVGGPFHQMLLDNGYQERARECAMYLNLAQFSLPEDFTAREMRAAKDGYEVCLFDKSRHSGIREMLEGFDNPLWKKEIAAATENGLPTVIAAQNGKAAGFAGPVLREECGRGYFSGIGVHPGHEGHGLGTLLFLRLCDAFRGVGADYMSLYTGQDNPAKNIYLKAGFVPVKEFAVMRKEFSR